MKFTCLFAVHHFPFCCYTRSCSPSRCSPLPFSLLHSLVFALSLCPSLASVFAGEVHVPFFFSPLPFSLRYLLVFAFRHFFSLCPTLTSPFAGEVHTLYLLIFADRLFFLLRQTRFPLYSSSTTLSLSVPFHGDEPVPLAHCIVMILHILYNKSPCNIVWNMQ